MAHISIDTSTLCSYQDPNSLVRENDMLRTSSEIKIEELDDGKRESRFLLTDTMNDFREELRQSDKYVLT